MPSALSHTKSWGRLLVSFFLFKSYLFICIYVWLYEFMHTMYACTRVCAVPREARGLLELKLEVVVNYYVDSGV